MSADRATRSPVLARGLITVALTEGLSLVHGLNRATVSVAWAIVAMPEPDARMAGRELYRSAPVTVILTGARSARKDDTS